jgi:putative SOS response-associated peptidase YedK
MCGRYSFSKNKKQVKTEFPNVEVPDELVQNYNLAPTQPAYVISNDQPLILTRMQWGLVPNWAQDPKMGANLINARVETLPEKPSFREALEQRRCLVLADGFYEWQKMGKQRRPYFIYPSNGQMLVMAGLWDFWQNDTQKTLSFSIITTPPNLEMSPIHDRMPLLLSSRDQQLTWLKTSSHNELKDLLHTPADGVLKMHVVSPLVNAVRNNGPQLHEKDPQISLFE